MAPRPNEEDMGYEDMDYGYGDAAPEEDYGYGDAVPDDMDYGYGDAAPEEDYGYGDAEPAAPEPAEAEKKRPKRRCSVTKFTLESQEGPASALMAADVIKNFRNAAPPAQPEPVVDDCKSTVTDGTFDSLAEVKPEKAGEKKAKSVRKKGMINRIRRRLSVAA